MVSDAVTVTDVVTVSDAERGKLNPQKFPELNCFRLSFLP